MRYLSDNQSQQLVLAQSHDLQPNSNEVLIATQASGINRANLLQLDGHYPPPAGASDIIGLEVAGSVLSAPPGSQFQVGDKVMALILLLILLAVIT
ncbi:MAG: alcohol dehydrogenase catalytic domain-containing protein [Gammaproteobacteria bacterium]|nr:alcohol dehydrogenase catalytic domain-containing protein [Gammaproteobacteria bacterium]